MPWRSLFQEQCFGSPGKGRVFDLSDRHAPVRGLHARQYALVLDGVKAQANNIGAGRTVAGTVDALVVAAQFFPCLGLEATLPKPPSMAHQSEDYRRGAKAQGWPR